MEKILRFEDLTGEYDGYRVVTDKQTIEFGISNRQSCCESWGYFSTPDDTKEFVGAELLRVAVVDDALNSHAVTEALGWDSNEVCVMFVNLETDKGTLQFTAYNSHNGYYSHTAYVKCQQVSEEAYL